MSPVGGPSDQTLMAHVVRRDEAALAALYDRYHVLAFTIALRITGDRAVAEEVLQDIFHAVWRGAAGFQPSGSVAAWLIGIARHRAIDATRRAAFRARVREQPLEPTRALPAEGQLEEEIARGMAGERVRAALQMLAPAQREAIELAYYGGLSHSEIAARLGAPLGTVKTRLRLGLLGLRRALGEPEPDEGAGPGPHADRR